MKNLVKLFPSVLIFFKEDGISSSAASALKNENTNKVNDLKTRLTPTNYYKQVDYLFGGNKVETSETDLKNKLVPADFDSINLIADLHLNNALLGQAIKYKEYMRDTISKMNEVQIAEIFGIENKTYDFPSYTLKSPFINNGTLRTDIESFCKLERIEDMYRVMNTDLLEKCAPFYKEAIKAEAIAATYGKFVTDDNGFLRKLFVLEPYVSVRKTIDKGMYLKEELEIAYNKAEWVKLRDSVYDTYTIEQKKRNSFVKQIKDFAREFAYQYGEEYRVALETQRDEYAKHSQLQQKFKNECNQIKIALLKEVADLKI